MHTWVSVTQDERDTRSGMTGESGVNVCTQRGAEAALIQFSCCTATNISVNTPTSDYRFNARCASAGNTTGCCPAAPSQPARPPAQHRYSAINPPHRRACVRRKRTALKSQEETNACYFNQVSIRCPDWQHYQFIKQVTPSTHKLPAATVILPPEDRRVKTSFRRGRLTEVLQQSAHTQSRSWRTDSLVTPCQSNFISFPAPLPPPFPECPFPRSIFPHRQGGSAVDYNS